MMLPRAALKAGMPFYKYAGNKILTWVENRMLRTKLSEFHSGYRVYSVDALRRIPFQRNSNGFCFDTEIIIQLVLAGARIAETPIPTYYGDEICHVNGLKYALDVTKATVAARLHTLGLVYDRRFDDGRQPDGEARYVAKLDYESPHSIALEIVPDGARVLDLGCAGGQVGAALERDKHCQVTGVDCEPPADAAGLSRFVRHDLSISRCRRRSCATTICIMMLDVIEHLQKPEQFVEDLYHGIDGSAAVTVVVSTGNVGFLMTRLMLLFGKKFDYGRRGILDISHTRLFTFRNLASPVRAGRLRDRVLARGAGAVPARSPGGAPARALARQS